MRTFIRPYSENSRRTVASVFAEVEVGGGRRNAGRYLSTSNGKPHCWQNRPEMGHPL